MQQVTLTPLVSARYQWVALSLGLALSAGAIYLPEGVGVWRLVLVAAGAVALRLGGRALSLPAWAANKPLVPLTLVPMLDTAYKALLALLTVLPPSLEPWAQALLALFALASGKVDQPPVGVEQPGGAKAMATCSIADRAGGKC